MSNSQRDANKAAEWAKRVLRAYEVASKARQSIEAAEEASKRASEIYRALESASNANARARAAEDDLRHRFRRSLEATDKERSIVRAAEEASKRAREIYLTFQAVRNLSAGALGAADTSSWDGLLRSLEVVSKVRASLEAAKKPSKLTRDIEEQGKSSIALRILEWLRQSSGFREMVHGTSLGFDFEPIHRYRTFERSDLEAVLSDWLVVGDDLRRAMREFDDRAPRAKESSEQGHPDERAIGREEDDLVRSN